VLATGYGQVETSNGNSALVGMQQKIGSGVIIDRDGSIVTNAHAIGGAQHVRVSIPTVDTYEATDEPIVRRTRTVDARVIHTLNGTAVKTSEELRSALSHTTANSPVVLQIERSGKLMFLAFKLDELSK
jgi:S1-C subfamily serine protease